MSLVTTPLRGELDGGSDLAALVCAARRARDVGQRLLAAATVGAGDEGRHSGLPLAATRPRVGSRHSALGDSHFYFSSASVFTRFLLGSDSTPNLAARPAQRGSSMSCPWPDSAIARRTPHSGHNPWQSSLQSGCNGSARPTASITTGSRSISSSTT